MQLQTACLHFFACAMVSPLSHTCRDAAAQLTGANRSCLVDKMPAPETAKPSSKNRFSPCETVSGCAVHPTPLFRVTVQPGRETGLRRVSQVMVDKATTVPRAKIGARMGRVDAATMQVINKAVIGFLGL